MASSSSTPARKYEVFLSFRGEDTRNTFVGHLYEALVLKGIVAFKDDHNLEKGQSISPELMKAIEDSKFAIIVFSKNYASSTWCLEELVKIMECKTEHAETVIPIFYDVDPSDVRKQKNSFAESFAKHELNFKDKMEKVQIWKHALEQAANISGNDVRGKNEASCIKEIVEDIFWKLRPKASTKDLVGIESHMTKLDSLLFKEPNGVCFVGIWGMGGIGKTTIATAIFEKHIGSFEDGCFLPDVSKAKMVDLQNTLISKVLNTKTGKITHEKEGSRKIAERFCSKKVLLVLDDVNDIDQLKSLAGEPEWFGSGSRIVITTRDEELLNDVNETYKVDLLSDDEAMHLFCWHAFKQSHPAQDFSQLSKRVVSYAGGLPLALKVLGSHLRRKTIDVWESALDRLKDAPEGKIFDVLKISFDGLSDTQKETFLDIACLYRGWKEDDVKERLHSCGFHPVESITVLIQRSLIHLLVGRIQMHDLIEEMGQHVVRQEAKNKPERYRRLWDPKDILNVLTSNTGTAEVEALVMWNWYGQFAQGTHEGVFKKMKQLRLLDIVDEYLIPNYLPNTLKWLSWRYYPGKYLPKDFPPINLVHLDLGGSSIVETPDVSGMPNLEVLNLERCEDLLEVHPSIGVHKKLVRLNLRGCYELEKFPRIIQMESLESLNLGYNSFVSLPESINRLSCLQVLNLRGCKMLEALPELPSSIKKLDLRACRALTRIPSLVDLFGNCKDLTFLSLVGCGQLVKNPIKQSASNVLCTRQEVLKVILPEIEIPDWFYRSAMPCVITLPPSWFNDKLRGFALFVNSFNLRFELHTCNGLVSFDDDDDIYGDIYEDDIYEGGAAFWYIPISKITRDREWKDQNDSFLFEIKNCGDVSWGIRLVYEGEVDQDITHLTMTNPEGKYWGQRLKICVAPRIHEEKPRDKQLLNKIGDIYKSDDEAMNLFCSHAFKQSHPAQDFFGLSNRVVSNAHGIRLALEVLGSHLCGQRIDVWESALDRLKDAPEYTIFTSLEISFEGLSNIEQNIFLDIACFYRGWNEDNVKKRLHSRGFHPDEGIPVLIQRSLIHILDGKIEMHDLIEEMGQYIVRQKGNFRPQRYSRLWFQYDICNVLLNNMGTAEIECLVYEEEEEMSFIKGINLSRTFRKMNKLRLLDIVTWGSKFSEDCEYLPNTLQWLKWRGYPGKYLPKDFQPTDIVHLDLRRSSIVETPDVSNMPNLEVLDLSRCYNLLKVHPSIGVHKKLVRLSLRWCRDLFKNRDGDEAVPCSDSQQLHLKRKRVEYDGPSKNVNMFSVLRSLPSLRTLDMSNCNVSEAIIPESIGCLASLQELYLSDNNFVSLPESINRLSCLQVLDLSDCKMLQALPEPPSSIKKLNLSGCTALTRVPSLVDILGKCEDLQYLSLEGCKQLLKNPVCYFLSPSVVPMVDLNVSLHNQETYDMPTNSSFFFSCMHIIKRCVSNILCTRHEVLQVYLPGREIPDWFLYQSRWGQVTVTLSPSSYNDKLRGFALCVGGYFSLKLSTCNGPMTLIGDYYYLWSGTAFLYIPIGTITSGRDQWKDQKDSFLFEVTNFGDDTSWGIHLVYEGEVDEDISHLTITNHYGPMRQYEAARLKVCVAARSHEEKEVVPAIPNTPTTSDKPSFIKLLGTYVYI